ncbi:MAG: hypothetical protein Q9180_007844 [Flavoplaca navasiana]
MSPKSFSSKTVFLAWAAQVSLVQLGARLVAYTDTKATITAFRIAVRHAASKPLGTLPEEVLDLIVEELREMVFEPELEESLLRILVSVLTSGWIKSWYTGLEGCCDFKLTAEAYLMLPVIRAPIATTPGPDVASLSIKHAIDLSLLVDLSDHQRQKFLKAAAILKLHRYNKYDDKSEYVENEK